MRKENLSITLPRLFSPISAFSAERNPYIMRFNVHGTFQINQSDFFIYNIKFIKGL